MNITIDDSSPDPLTGVQIIYGRMSEIAASPNGWVPGQTCPGCFAQPDPLQAFNNTWHDSTYNFGKDIPYASVSFIGTAVYVMGIIVSSAPASNTSFNNSRLFFQIDGENQTNYLHIASLGSEVTYSYNIPFFVREDLPFELHNITIMNGDGEPTVDSLCLLDRIIYTTEVENSSHVSGVAASGSITRASSPSSNAGIQTVQPQFEAYIIGGITGALTSFVALVVVLWCWDRNRRRRQAIRHQSITRGASSSGIGGGSDSEPPSYDTVVSNLAISDCG